MSKPLLKTLVPGLMIFSLSFAEITTSTPVSLDFLIGDWAIEDAVGNCVSTSRIQGQAKEAMLFEERIIGDKEPQPLWFENSERTGGWV